MPEAAERSGYIMGFDFGLRRIGVAIGQKTTRTASCLETVSHGKHHDWPAIDRLVSEWKPSILLVGLPLGSEGDETDMSRAARRFGDSLRARYGLNVEFADERLSSRAAGSHFIDQRASGNLRRKDASKLDAMAARIILENWLQND